MVVKGVKNCSRNNRGVGTKHRCTSISNLSCDITYNPKPHGGRWGWVAEPREERVIIQAISPGWGVVQYLFSDFWIMQTPDPQPRPCSTKLLGSLVERPRRDKGFSVRSLGNIVPNLAYLQVPQKQFQDPSRVSGFRETP